MLNLLDESLEEFLRAEVPLAKRSVDVSFDAPDADWGSSITKPTVNLYLWDIRRNLEEREGGWELVEENGVRTRRRKKPRVDIRYLVTAWTSETRDEHALLGEVLAALLRYPDMPEDHLVGSYGEVRPLPSLSVASVDPGDQSDFWSALGGQLKPGLDLMVTATVDVAADPEAGPPVETYDIDVTDQDTPGTRSNRHLVGGRAVDNPLSPVRGPRGSAATNRDGEFLIAAEPGDRLTLEDEDKDEEKTAEVPDKGSVEM